MTRKPYAEPRLVRHRRLSDVTRGDRVRVTDGRIAKKKF